LWKFQITVKSLHNRHLGDRGKWPLSKGDRYGEGGATFLSK